MDSVVEDPTVFLDQVRLPSDGCLALVSGIAAGTESIVSDGSFNPESLLGRTGISAIVLVPSTKCSAKFFVKGNNWVTGASADLSAYRNGKAGEFRALTMLDVVV